jgi:spermidine synthase
MAQVELTFPSKCPAILAFETSNDPAQPAMITLAERKSRFGPITIFRKEETGSLIYAQADCFQSEADADGISLVAYIHAHYGLLRQARSQTVLMIGCGGGTLATMLTRADCKVTVVDIDPQAFLLARRYFGFPESVTCRVADGAQYLIAEERTFDAVVVDAFMKGYMPDHLLSRAFFTLVRRRLNASGCVFVNVHVEHDFDRSADRVAAAMAALWPTVRVLDRPGHAWRNAVVMAGDVLRLEQPSLQVWPATGAEPIAAELNEMQFRLWQAGG